MRGASSFLISNSGEVIDEPSTTVGERLEFCKGGLKKLCDSKVRTAARMSAMDDNLNAMTSMIEKMTSCDLNSNFAHSDYPKLSQSQHQVTHLTMEQHQDSLLGYRYDALDIGNGESVLHKIEMPMFDGTHPYVWIVRVERFFQLGRYKDDAKLDLVFLCLEGAAYKWFSREMRQRRFLDWNDFKSRLLDQFVHVDNHSTIEVKVLDELTSGIVKHTEVMLNKDSLSMTVHEANVEASSVTSNHKQRKSYKSWKFKYKTRFLQQLRSHGVQLKIMDQLILRYFSLYMISQRSWAVVLWWYHWKMRHRSKGMTRLVVSDTTSHIRHKWRSPMRLPLQMSTLTQMKVLHMTFGMTQKVLRALVMIIQPVIQKRYNVTYQRMMRKLHLSRVMWKMWLRQTFQELKLGDGEFQVKHKWKFKQRLKERVDQAHLCLLRKRSKVNWQWFSLNKNKDQSQLHGSSRRSSQISFFSPSLRTSLFSGEGVYKRIQTCLLLRDVLNWRYVREQHEKSELITQGLLQTVFQQFIHDHAIWKCSEPMKRKLGLQTRVSTVLNHLLLKEMRALLIRHMGPLLQLLMQQRQKWKKYYKNRMFKYKVRIRRD